MPVFVLEVNGGSRTVEVRDDAEPLLFVLRNRLGLTGAKYGCGLGQCGACTVLIDGEAVRSCTLPVARATGKSITTIESLSQGKPHPLQQAFVEQQAAQCGYCIPGMVMQAAALLRANPRPNRDDVKEALAGNLCRCGAHQRVVDAVLLAAGTK
jgi:nicotinate dehydrogenase subunit A